MKQLRHGRIRETMKKIGRACLKAAAPLAVAAALYFSPNLALADTCKAEVGPMVAGKQVDWQKRGRRYLFFRMFIPLSEDKALVVKIPDRFMRKNRKLTAEGFGNLTLVNGNQAIALFEQLTDKTNAKWQWKCLKADEAVTQPAPGAPPAPTVRLPSGVTGKGTLSEPYKLTVNLKGGGVMIAVPASLSGVGAKQFYWIANISYSPTNHTSRDVSTELARKLYALMRAATGQRPGFQGVLDDLHAKMQEMNKSSNYQMWPGEKPKGSPIPAPGSGSKPKIEPPKSDDPLEGILGEEGKAPDRPATAQEQENMAKWLDNMKKKAATGRTGQPPKPRLFDRKNPMQAFRAPPYRDQINAAIKMAKKKAISGKLLIVIRIDSEGKPTSVQFSSNNPDMKRAMADGDNKDMKNLLTKLRAIFMRMRWKKQNIPAITYSPIIR